MAVEAKNRGNAAFSAGKFDEAIAEFSTAIELDSNNHILFRLLIIYDRIYITLRWFFKLFVKILK